MAIINLASALKNSLYKWKYLVDSNYGQLDRKGDTYHLSVVPLNRPVELFQPYKTVYGNDSTPNNWLGFTTVLNITSGNVLFNSWGVRERDRYLDSYGNWDQARNEYYHFPTQDFYDRNVGSIFIQNEEPTDLLTFDEELMGDSNMDINISLLSGWEYNKTDLWSSRILHYVLKITNDGANGTAKFVFKKKPYITNTVKYTNSSWNSFYSEALHGLINQSTGKVHWLNGQLPKEHDALWAETRRKDPDVSNKYVTLMLPDDRTLQYFEWIQPLEYEKVEYTLSIPCKQATWFNGTIILLGLDMKLYRYLPESGLNELYSTSFNAWDDVMLVTHPDQDYCYLLGGTSQVIINSSFTVSVVSETWSGLEQGLGYTTFDVNGKIWVGNVRRSEVDLSVEYTHSVPALCNYTYLGASDGTCYALDGSEYANTSSEFATDLYTSDLRWRFPQAVLTPYNANDFESMTNQDIWYGYNLITEEFEEYDGSNAILIPATDLSSGYASVEIVDGVQLNFNDDNGVRSMITDDIVYFTVAQGYVKDDLTQLQLKLLLSSKNYTYHSVNMTIVSTEYDITESGGTDFLDMNTTIIIGYWDNDVDFPITFTTSDTTLESDYVYVNTDGSMIFNATDVGRIVTIEYYVATGD